MKKTIILVVFAFVASTAFTQTFKKDLSAAKSAREKGDLAKAKEMIDKSITYPEASTDAEVYDVRGNIYLEIASKPEFRKLAADPLEVAEESFKKCGPLDTKGKYKLDLIQKDLALTNAYFNEGATAVNTKEGTPDYTRGAKYFMKAYNAKKEAGTKDTLALYGYAFCMDKLGEKDKAIEAYTEVFNAGMNDLSVIVTLSNLLREKGRTDDALAILKKGLEVHPGDMDLIISQANIYIQTKNHAKALENLEAAKAKEPNNKTILFAVGVTYDLMKNDTSLSAANKEDYFHRAEKSYLESIKVDSNFFDANFNLGAMYFNKGGDLINAANQLPVSETAKYDGLLKQGNGYLTMAVPFLEKALQIQPKDENTYRSLKEIYTRLNMMGKLKALNDKFQK